MTTEGKDAWQRVYAGDDPGQPVPHSAGRGFEPPDVAQPVESAITSTPRQEVIPGRSIYAGHFIIGQEFYLREVSVE